MIKKLSKDEVVVIMPGKSFSGTNDENKITTSDVDIEIVGEISQEEDQESQQSQGSQKGQESKQGQGSQSGSSGKISQWSETNTKPLSKEEIDKIRGELEKAIEDAKNGKNSNKGYNPTGNVGEVLSPEISKEYQEKAGIDPKLPNENKQKNENDELINDIVNRPTYYGISPHGFGTSDFGRIQRKEYKAIVNWRHELQKSVKQVLYGNNVKFKTSRDNIGSDGVVPWEEMFTGEETNNIIVAIDTSGSIDDDAFNVLLSELFDIVSKFNLKTLRLIFFDTEIKKDLEFKGARKAKDFLKTKNVERSSGGTDYIVPCKYLLDNSNIKLNKYNVIIFFTDIDTEAMKSLINSGLKFSISDQNKFIWLIARDDYNLQVVPWGRKINLTKDQIDKTVEEYNSKHHDI